MPSTLTDATSTSPAPRTCVLPVRVPPFESRYTMLTVCGESITARLMMVTLRQPFSCEVRCSTSA